MLSVTATLEATSEGQLSTDVPQKEEEAVGEALPVLFLLLLVLLADVEGRNKSNNTGLLLLYSVLPAKVISLSRKGEHRMGAQWVSPAPSSICSQSLDDSRFDSLLLPLAIASFSRSLTCFSF